MTQIEWDTLLVTTFITSKAAPVWRLWDMDDHENINGLKRVPKLFHSKYDVCRFVAGHLPKLAKVLWVAQAHHVPKIVELLQKSNIDTDFNNESGKTARDAKGYGRTKKEYLAMRMSVSADLGVRDKASGHDWGTVK